MDTMNILAVIYKQELAEANEQKVLFKAQLEITRQENEQLKQKIAELEKQLPEIVD